MSDYLVVRRETSDGVLEFRWNLSLTVNVFIGERSNTLDEFSQFDTIMFMEKPTFTEMVRACEERTKIYAETADPTLESLFEKGLS
jgi:hypothetical protein